MIRRAQALKALATLALSAFALTACTYASEQPGGGILSVGPTDGMATSNVNTISVTRDNTLAARVPESIRERGTLRVGSDTSYAPAEFLDPSTQQPTGYDVELAKALAQVLGLKPEVQTADFTGILPALGSKYDIGQSSFSITPERLESVNMVSYFRSGTAWAVKKGNSAHIDPTNVCGKIVGVQTGTIQADEVQEKNQECAKTGKESIQIVTLPKQADLTTRLTNGQIQTMSADAPVIADAIAKTDGALERVGDITDQSLEGIAVAKNDTQFAGLVKDAMTRLSEEGVYGKILDKWGVGDFKVTEFEVNPKPPSS